MILDAIVGLFVPLFALLSEAAATICFPLVNLVAAAIEGIAGLFGASLSLGRLEKKKRGESERSRRQFVALTTILGIASVAILLFLNLGKSREITLVARDGHALPFAALIVRDRGEVRHFHTDEAGNFRIADPEEVSVTIKDPRYEEATWNGDEIGRELVVERSGLGSTLDEIATALLERSGR